MKKIISLFLMVFLLVGTLGGVVAADDEAAVPVAKKIGFFEDRMDRMKLAFTFNKEKHIERVLEMAEKRLAEAELLAEENPEAYERAQARYDELVAKAEEDLSEIESDAEDENSSVENMEKIARIQNQFERHRDHTDEIYARALERFAANNASAEKIERFEMFHERALNRSNMMEQRAIEKRENAVRKHKALSEMSDEELNELLEKIDSDEGLIQARENRMEQAEKRIQKLEEKGVKNVEQMRARIENANLDEEQKERLRERLENSEERLDNRSEFIRERLETREEFMENRTERLRDVIEDELESRGNNSEENESD